MNCRRWERWLALDVEGDLPEPRRGALERHLRECEACAALAEELGASQGLLKSLNADRVPDASLARVRRDVLPRAAALQASPDWRLRLERAVMAALRPRYAFSAVAVVLAVGALVVSGLVPGPAIEPAPAPVAAVTADTAIPPVERPPVPPPIESPADLVESAVATASAQPETAPVSVAVNAAPLLDPRPTPVVDTVAPAAVNADRPPTVVKLVTDDPNIIIYWLVDSGEGGGA